MLSTARHIGIVACSAEGAALCYRTICLEAAALMGEHNHPQITMDSIPLFEYMRLIKVDDWKETARLLLRSVERVAQAGADFAICPDNTCHQAFEYLLPSSPIPWLHIAEVVSAEAQRQGFRRLGILGTRYLMESPVYSEAAARHSLECEIPDELERDRINTIIFKQLVNGVFTEASRLYLNEVMARLRDRGCDAVVLGCTEIPLLVCPDDTPLPTLDSTRLLAKAAVERACR